MNQYCFVSFYVNPGLDQEYSSCSIKLLLPAFTSRQEIAEEVHLHRMLWFSCPTLVFATKYRFTLALLFFLMSVVTQPFISQNNIFLDFTFNYVYIRGGIHKYSAHRGQNLELELQVVVSYPYGFWEPNSSPLQE